MSRHRNVRTMNYEDEYAGYDDVYGHSVEDDYCVSPSTAAQFMYNRGEQHSLSAYVAAEGIPEEEGESEEEADHLNDSGSLARPRLSSMDEAKLNSCLEEMRNVLGDATTEQVMVDAVMKYNYNLEKALDYLLTQQKDAPKPQRKPRQNRRSRSDEDDNDMTPSGSPQTDLSSQSDFFPPFCPELPTDDLNPPTVSVPGPGLISPALLTGLLTTSDFTATQNKPPPGYSDINKSDPANPSIFANPSHVITEPRLPRPPPGFAQLPTNIATKTDVNKNLQSFIASFSGNLSSASPKDVSPLPVHDTPSNYAFNQNIDQIKTGITVSDLCTDTGTTESNTWEQSDCSVVDGGVVSETMEKHVGPGGHIHTDLSSLAASIQKDSMAANTQKHDVASHGLLQSGSSSLLLTGSSMPDASEACGSPAAGLSKIDSATGTGLNLADLAKEQQRTNQKIQTEVKMEKKKVPSLSLSELTQQQQQSSAKPAGQTSKAIDVPGSKTGVGLAALAAKQQNTKAAALTGSHQVFSPETKLPGFSLAALAVQHQAASDKKQGSLSGSPVIIGSPSVTSALTTEKKGAGFSLAALAAQHRSASSSPLSSVSGSPVILGSPGMYSLSTIKGVPSAGFEHHAAPRSTQSSVSGSPHTIGSPVSVAGERTNPGLSLSALIAQQKTTQGTRSSTSSESHSYSGSPSLAELAIGHQRTVTGGQVSINKGNKDQKTGQPGVVGSPMSGNSSGLSLAALAFQHSSAQGPKGSAGLQGANSPVPARPGAGSDAASVTSAKRNKNKQKSKPATQALKALKTEKGAANKISSINSEPAMHVSVDLKGKPSAFASAISCNISNNTARDKIKRIKSKFSYTRQNSGTITAPLTPHPIKPFDFSSPSPDDIVRHKQRAAFGSRKSNQINEKPTEISKAQPQKSEPQVVKAAYANSEFKTGSDGIAKMTFASAKPVQTGFTPVPEGKNSKVVKVDKPKATERSEPEEVDAAAGAVAMETDLKPAPQKEQVATPVATKSKSKVNKAAARRAYAERKAEGGKDLINLVVVGHVDAGKSTLMGHLLFQLGFVNKRMMHKYEQESKKIGKASFAYAWVLDETEEERARGVTMDIAQTHFETPTKSVTLLDAPGHKDFIPNMITGAAQADVAILVINATRGEFETGFDSGGQTREHAMLIRSLGVSQLLVAINKMDTVEWSKERFEEITKKLSTFLKQAGFKENDVMFVPCSGLSGQNLTKPPEEPRLAAWYNGQTLADSIDKFRPPERPIDKPLRLCVADVFKGSSSGVAMAGTVQAGTVQVGEKVLIMPQAEQAVIKSILIDEGPSQFAFAGDAVTITLTGIEQTDVGIGSIICDDSSPIRSALRVRARVVVFSIDVPLTKGFPVVFHYQTLSEPAHIKRLVSQLHKSTGEVIRRKPRCLTKNMNAVIEVELERPVCIELYKDYKDLGRFMLRYGGKTIAAGLVTEILEKKSSRAD